MERGLSEVSDLMLPDPATRGAGITVEAACDAVEGTCVAVEGTCLAAEGTCVAVEVTCTAAEDTCVADNEGWNSLISGSEAVDS